MDDMNDTQFDQKAPEPSPALKKLEILVGTWDVSGGVQGRLIYDWMEGGFFLLQHVDMNHQGHRIKGVEVIGHLKPFGGEPSQDIKSRWYDNEGNTFDYVYEVEGDTLTIWGGERGSPAYYQGQFSDDGNTLTGGWVYPGGGGYDAIAVKV
jgi:hypothetical protein